MKRKNFKRVVSGIAAMSLLASVGAVNVMADSTLAASVYADDNGVVLDFSQDIQSTADLSGIELYKAGVKADGFIAAVEADGDVVLTGAVERNAMYTVKVPAGFVDGSSAIEKKFVVKEVFSENFNSTENGKLPSTIVGTAGNTLSVQNGEMQHTDGNFYLNYTGKDYTVSYDVKAYQTSTGTDATAENKYAGNTAPNFMRLLYNVGSKTTSFTGQGCYTMSLRNHEASRADVMRISRGGTKWSGSEWSFSDGNSDYTQTYVDYPHSPAYGVTSNAVVPLKVITDADAPQAAAFKLTSRKIANDIDLYVDGAHAANYIGGARTATNDILTEGYFGVQEGLGGKCASVYDNISITACFEPTNTEVTDIYADAYGVYLTFGADVTDLTDTAGITLTDSKGADVPFTVSGKGKTLTLSAALSNDVYSVSVGEGFGGGVVALENEYTKQFKVKEVTLADSDFNGATVENGVVTIANDKVMTLMKGYDKENYTLSFKLNVEEQRNPKLRMWYNAAAIGNFHADNNKAYVVTLFKNATILSHCANKDVSNLEKNTGKIEHTESYSDGSTIALNKNGRNMKVLLNGKTIAEHEGQESYTKTDSKTATFDTTGYFGIWNVSSEANSGTSAYVTLSDVKLTYFAEYDPQPMTVSGWYADKEGVIVTLDQDMSDISTDQLSKVGVTENGEEIAIESIKADGGKVVIETKEELKNNTVYDVELEKGFGTESFVLTDKFLAQFKLTEKFYEDFSDAVFDGGIVAGSAAKDKQYDGAFYLWADTMYIKDTKNYASYTLSFDLKSYSTKKTNDAGVETTDAAPKFFRPFFTGEDKFFTSCEAYVWNVANQADSVAISRGGPKYDETKQTWSGYEAGQYNVNGQNDIYSKSLNYGKLKANANEVPYSIDTETAGANVVTVRKNGTLAQLYFDGGYASSLNLPNSFETCYFGVQDGSEPQAYIIDNVRLTVCEPVTSTVRALKLTVNDADGNKLESLSGISYAKGEVTVKNYTDGEKPVVCVVAAYDEHNKLLAANIIEIENGKVAKKSSQTKPYELKNISGVKEISVFCWDGFDTIVPYCSAITVK